MRARVLLFLGFSAFFSVSALALKLQEPPAPAEAQDPVEQVPAEPVRVVGQAQTQEEIDAWNAIGQVATPGEQIRLFEQFLVDYPTSGLTPFAHYNLAGLYRGQDDIDNFIVHGEKALEELPALPDILGYLAFFYAEKGNNERASECANRTIQLIGAMTRPVQLSEADWAVRKYELLGEANYALGRVALSKAAASQAEGDAPILADAVRYFREALKQAPQHPYASFRLAETYTRRNELESAIETYGRVVALGGVIGDFARSKLQTVYEHVHGNTDGMQAVIDNEQAELQQELAERNQLLEEMRSSADPKPPSLQQPEEGVSSSGENPAKPPF